MPDPHATPDRPAEIPVKIKVSQNTFWWLVDRSRERFGGDLDATILDLLQRVEGGKRDV